jgi:hypothetical protein
VLPHRANGLVISISTFATFFCVGMGIVVSIAEQRRRVRRGDTVIMSIKDELELRKTRKSLRAQESDFR